MYDGAVFISKSVLLSVLLKFGCIKFADIGTLWWWLLSSWLFKFIDRPFFNTAVIFLKGLLSLLVNLAKLLSVDNLLLLLFLDELAVDANNDDDGGVAVVAVCWYVEDGSNSSRSKSLITHAIASGGSGGVSMKSSRNCN